MGVENTEDFDDVQVSWKRKRKVRVKKGARDNTTANHPNRKVKILHTRDSTLRKVLSCWSDWYWSMADVLLMMGRTIGLMMSKVQWTTTIDSEPEALWGGSEMMRLR